MRRNTRTDQCERFPTGSLAIGEYDSVVTLHRGTYVRTSDRVVYGLVGGSSMDGIVIELLCFTRGRCRSALCEAWK